MATFRKVGKKTRAELFVLGRRESKTFDSKMSARAWADEREEQLRGGSTASDTLRAGLKDYALEVSTKKRGRRWEELRLAKIAREFRAVDQPMAAITQDDIIEWRDGLAKRVKPGSVIREMGLLACVFEHARVEWRWIKVNPMRGVKKPSAPPARVMRISEDQANLLFALAGYVRGKKPKSKTQLVAAAFDFALETGMRAGEIRGLRGERMFVDQHYVSIDRSKTGPGRDVPLSKDAAKILKGLDKAEPFPITGPQLDALFRKLTRKLGFKFTFHDTRHEAITRLARKLDVRDLARMVGHSNLSELLTYYNPTASELAARLRGG